MKLFWIWGQCKYKKLQCVAASLLFELLAQEVVERIIVKERYRQYEIY